jgi:uncharacterized protein (UPF0332 family)
MFTERLAQAKENLKEAKLLHGERMGNRLVVRKLYHTIIYSLFALMRINEIQDLTHADIIKNFETRYVRKGVFDLELLSVIRRAYDLAHVCGYEPVPVPQDEDVKKIMPIVEEFIEQVEKYLNEEG